MRVDVDSFAEYIRQNHPHMLPKDVQNVAGVRSLHVAHAQVRYDEAAETVAGIIFQLNTIGQRAASIAARLRKVPITVEDYTISEGPLFCADCR